MWVGEPSRQMTHSSAHGRLSELESGEAQNASGWVSGASAVGRAVSFSSAIALVAGEAGIPRTAPPGPTFDLTARPPRPPRPRRPPPRPTATAAVRPVLAGLTRPTGGGEETEVFVDETGVDEPEADVGDGVHAMGCTLGVTRATGKRAGGGARAGGDGATSVGLGVMQMRAGARGVGGVGARWMVAAAGLVDDSMSGAAQDGAATAVIACGVSVRARSRGGETERRSPSRRGIGRGESCMTVISSSLLSRSAASATGSPWTPCLRSAFLSLLFAFFSFFFIARAFSASSSRSSSSASRSASTSAASSSAARAACVSVARVADSVADELLVLVSGRADIDELGLCRGRLHLTSLPPRNHKISP